MSKPKFSIADFAAPAVSDLDHLEVRLLPWADIRGNAGNFYAVNDVEDLVNSIRMHGLLDPVVVMADPDPEAADAWVLVSGHRRHKAWGILREEDPEKYAAIPAVVREFESAAMAELALIMANSASRTLTSAEISRQAERIEMLLYELKELGYEFHGRMRDQVAAACKVSGTKLARLKVIREKLVECWHPKWEAGDLAEDTAYRLAQLPADFQVRVAGVIKKPTGDQIRAVAEEYDKGARWENDKKMKCPGGALCERGDSFLLHDSKCWPGERCRGRRCCLKCDAATRNYGRCSSACSKAKAAYEDAKAQREAKAAEDRRREVGKLQKAVMASAARLMQAIDAAGLPDDEAVTTGWYRKCSVADVRAMAAGTYDCSNMGSNPLEPKRLDADDVLRLAELTGVSADWIMGLTDYMWPADVSKSDRGQPAAPAAELQPAAPERWRRCDVYDPADGQPVILLTEGVDGGYWTAHPAIYREERDAYEDLSGFSLAAGGCDLTVGGEAYWIPAPDIPARPPARG